MLDKQEILEFVKEVLDSIPRPNEQLRECETALNTGNTIQAINIIKKDDSLARHISSLNLAYLKHTGIPLFARSKKLDAHDAEILLKILHMHYVSLATPKRWRIFSVAATFKNLQRAYLFDFHRLTNDKGFDKYIGCAVALLPLAIGICDMVLSKLMLNPKEFCANLNQSYNALLISLCGFSAFTLLEKVAKSWELLPQVIAALETLTKEETNINQQATNQEKRDLFLATKVLFGFEFSRPDFLRSGLDMFLDFDNELNIECLERFNPKLGEPIATGL